MQIILPPDDDPITKPTLKAQSKTGLPGVPYGVPTGHTKSWTAYQPTHYRITTMWWKKEFTSKKKPSPSKKKHRKKRRSTWAEGEHKPAQRGERWRLKHWPFSVLFSVEAARRWSSSGVVRLLFMIIFSCLIMCLSWRAIHCGNLARMVNDFLCAVVTFFWSSRGVYICSLHGSFGWHGKYEKWA